MVPALLDPPVAPREPAQMNANASGFSLAALLDLPEFRARLVPMSVEVCETLTNLGPLTEADRTDPWMDP